MASENQVGIGFAARDSGFVSTMQQLIEAVQQLTTSVTGLNTTLTSSAGASEQLEEAQAGLSSASSQVASSTKLAAEEIIALTQALVDAQSESANTAEGWQALAQQMLSMQIGGEQIAATLVNLRTAIDPVTAGLQSVIPEFEALSTTTQTGIDAMVAAGQSYQEVSAYVKAMGESIAALNEYLQQNNTIVMSSGEVNNAYYTQLFSNLAQEDALRKQTLDDAKAYFTQLAALEQQQESIDNAYYTQLFQEMGMTSTERKQALDDAKATFFTEEELNTERSNSIMTARGLRFEVMALMMVMMEMNTVMQGNTQQMTILREGTMAMADSMMVMAMIPGPAGLAIGTLTALIGALGIAAQLAADPNVDALNKEIDKLGQKDDATVGLANLAGVTTDQAQAALDAAKNNSEYANSLNATVKAAEPTAGVMQNLQSAVQAVGDKLGEAATYARDLAAILMGGLATGTAEFEVAIGAIRAEDLPAILDTINKNMAEIGFGASASASALKDLSDIVKNPAPTTAQGSNLDQVLNAYTTYKDSVASANKSLTEQDAQVAYDRTLAENKANTDILSARADLNTKLSDLAWTEQHTEALTAVEQTKTDATYQLDRVKQEDQANDEIQKNRLELALSLMQSDFNTAEQGYKAKTYSEYLEIQRRGQFEDDMTKAKSALATDDIQTRLTEEESYAAQKKAIDDSASAQKQALDQLDYQHKQDLDRRDEAQKETDIKNQEVLQETAFNHQTDLIKQKYEDQLATARQRYDQELAKSKETNDGVTRGMALLQNQYLADWADRKAALQDETTMRTNLANIPFSGGWTGGNTFVGVTGYATGTSFVIPPGFNENFPIGGRGASSGETVTVTPAGQNSGGSGGNTTVHVYIDGQEFKGMIRYQIDEVDRGR